MSLRSLALLLAFALVSAGCLGGTDDAVDPEVASGPGEDGTDADSPGTGADAAARANRTDTGEGLPNASVGEMEHFHDYWKGRERVTLFDGEIEPDAFTTTFFTFYDVFFRKNPAVGGAFLRLPDGAIVFEGTGKVEVTATWQDPRVSNLGLRYRSAAGPDFSEDLVALASGETVGIDVTPEMTDLPHAATSKWAFLFEPAGPGGMVAGPFHVRVDVVKMRDVELFPGHPDHFEGRSEKVLLDASHTSKTEMFATRLVDFASGNFDQGEGLPPEHIVPMQTREMQVRVVIESASAAVGDAHEAYLMYRSADHGGWHWARPMVGGLQSGEILYYFPVEPVMVDSPYADESQWRFGLHVTSSLADGLPDCGGCTEAEATYRITVTALDHREFTEGWSHGDEEPRGGDDDDDA